MRIRRIVATVVLTAISFSFLGKEVGAQMPNQAPAGNPGMGMILFPVERATDEQQYITTRAGYKVALPGIGIDPNATQLATFQDAQNNFWYVNKNGQPTPVSAEQMQSVMAQIQQQQVMRQGQYPQYPQQASAPVQTAAPQPQQSTAPQQSSGSGSSGNSAMVSGLAAAGGAALGAGVVNAINNNNNNQYPYGYGGVPYGQPIYRQATGQYYYNNAAGAHTYVTPNTNTTAYFNQYEQQQQQKQQMATQAAQSKEGQESGRHRRFGRGQSNQAQSGQASALQQAAASNNQQGQGSRRSRRQRELGGSGGLLNR
jgi:hypothetical protein